MSIPGSGKVAVVSGASQGLGRALSGALARSGWSLVLDGRRGDRLRDALASLPPGVVVDAIPGDITDPSHRQEIAEGAARLGPVHLIVNNASTLGASPLPEMLLLDPDLFSRIFDVNVIAPFALVRALDAQLAPGATIINVTSDAAVEPYPTWGGYGASKAALEHASRVFAAERPDLRVLVVDPGDMRTEMHADAFPGEDISDRPEPETSVPGFLALINGDQPSGRYVAREVERTEPADRAR